LYLVGERFVPAILAAEVPMSKINSLTLVSAMLGLAGCAGQAATTPSPATLALYDVNAPRVEAAPSATSNASTAPRALGSSSGVTPIGDFVRSRNAQLQFCYGETRAANPTLAGSVTIGVLLAPDGTVTRADVLRRSWEGKGAADVETCALAKVRNWRFPPSDGTATRPYSFSAVFTR
jgi:TonB family protein